MTNNTIKATAICYRMHTPIIFNKGTKWEVARDTFLAYYTVRKGQEAQEEVEALNSGKVTHLPDGEPTDHENRTFFVEEEVEVNYY